jgi:hypothetical protein
MLPSARLVVWFVASLFHDPSGLSGGPDWDPASRRNALGAIIFLVLLALIGLRIVHMLRQMDALQDCVMQGRTNCVPSRHYINTPPP